MATKNEDQEEVNKIKEEQCQEVIDEAAGTEEENLLRRRGDSVSHCETRRSGRKYFADETGIRVRVHNILDRPLNWEGGVTGNMHLRSAITVTLPVLLALAMIADLATLVAFSQVAAAQEPEVARASAKEENFARVDAKELPDLLLKVESYDGDALSGS